MPWAASPRSLAVTNAAVLAIANHVEVARYGSQAWDPAYVQPRNQVLDPGDRARPHRHTFAAIRFATRADGAATIVNGRRCDMREGDLILCRR